MYPNSFEKKAAREKLPEEGMGLLIFKNAIDFIRESGL